MWGKESEEASPPGPESWRRGEMSKESKASGILPATQGVTSAPQEPPQPRLGARSPEESAWGLGASASSLPFSA